MQSSSTDTPAAIRGAGLPSPPTAAATKVHGRRLVYTKAEMRALSSSQFALARPADLLNDVDRYADT